MLQQRHLRRFDFGLIASRNQHNRRRNRKQNNGAEEEPKGRSKKSFQEKILKKRPRKKNGISDQRISGNIIPPLTGNDNLRQKAELGNAEAQVQLAKRLSAIRPRLSTNYVEAYKWAAIAASQDASPAKYLVRELEVFLTSREMAEAKRAVEAFAENRRGRRD